MTLSRICVSLFQKVVGKGWDISLWQFLAFRVDCTGSWFYYLAVKGLFSNIRKGFSDLLSELDSFSFEKGLVFIQ